MQKKEQEKTQLKESTERLGYAPLLRLLLSLSLPAISSMVTMSLYNIADTFWLAKLGYEAIAALTIVMPFFGIVLSIAYGTGVGVGSLVSRCFGEGNVEVTNRIAGQIFPLTLLVGVLAMIAATGFTDQILRLSGATPDIMEFGREYLTVIGFGGIFVFFGMVSSELLRGSGDAVRPMIFMVSPSIINIILDPFLIFGWWIFPEMGVQGAAVATLIAQGIGATLSFGYLVFQRSAYKIKLSYLKPDFKIIKDIYRVGLPSMLTELTETALFVMLNNVLATYGSVAIAAVGLIIRVIDFAFMPIIGVAEGMLPIVGFNFGARKWKRLWGVLKIAVLLLAGILTTATIILEIWAPQFIGFFSPEPELAEIAVPAMRIVIAVLPVIGAVILFITMFQGLGKGKAVLLLSLARQMVFFVPGLYILSHYMGLTGVWISMPISDFCGFLVTGSWLYREYRRLRKTPGWVDLPEETEQIA